jgi:hypothetical protein
MICVGYLLRMTSTGPELKAFKFKLPTNVLWADSLIFLPIHMNASLYPHLTI